MLLDMFTVSQYYHEWKGKVKEHVGKKYLIINDYMIDKALDNIKETIGIEKCDDVKILLIRVINYQIILL